MNEAEQPKTGPGSTAKGDSGDRRNSPDAEGVRLLEREPPAGYLDHWSELLSQAREESTPGLSSALVFRLGEEWLALPCALFQEITAPTPVHKIPHRTDRVLLGLANVRGELHLAVSLQALLEIEQATSPTPNPHQRMAVIRKDGETYVVPVDEIVGVYHFHPEQLTRAPVTVEKAAATHTRGLFNCDGKTVACLDEELVFYNIKRHLA